MATTRINDHEIEVDERGRACMTALWILAGRPGDKKPSQFKRLKRVRVMDAMARYSDQEWASRRGRHATSWAWIDIAVSYAEHLGLVVTSEGPRARDKTKDQRDFDEMMARKRREADERFRAQCAAEGISETPFSDEMRAAREEARAEDRAGEEWKGDDYNGDTQGEEWKGEPRSSPHPRFAGFTWGLDDHDDLYFEFATFRGVRLRACCN